MTMIDIDFLTPPPQIKSVSGMEYIDYQGKDFFNRLTDFVIDIYNPTTYELAWNARNREQLADIIAQYTNIRVVPQIEQMDNFAITAGFVSPNSVLNNLMAEFYLSKDESAIGKFFKEFKSKAVVGWCDLKTGKVHGDFAKVSFTLYLPMKMFITEKELGKLAGKVTIQQVIAGAILHETGHAFFGLHQLSSSIIEDIFFIKTAGYIEKEENLGNKLKIASEFRKETGIDISDGVKKSGKVTIVDFNKGMKDRDYRRTLSLGTTIVTTEILANAYAVRMGATLGIGAFYAGIANKQRNTDKLRVTEVCIYAILLGMGVVIPVVLYLLAVRITMFSLMFRLETFNSTHETTYRTIKSILRDTIDILRKARNDDDKKTVAVLTREAMLLDKAAEEAKPLLEGSTLHSLLGAFYLGKDAKRMDVEMYTSELNYNPLSIYTQLNEKG